MAETNTKTETKASEAPRNKASEAPSTKAEMPTDRPMTGPLTRDDGVRTKDGLHPLDPAYSGTVLQKTESVKQAEKAREEAGLVPGPTLTYGTDQAVVEKEAADKS